MKIILTLFGAFVFFYYLYMMYTEGEKDGGYGIFYVIAAVIYFWMVWH